MTRLLLLAGTGEARQIARALGLNARLQVTASLAGATRFPADLGVPTRVGGFGGDAGFADYLGAHGVSAVLDATHPFAAHISRRSAAVCAANGVPYMQFLRPAWQAGPGDDWTFLTSEDQAAGHMAADAVVFLATGPQRLDRFANLAGRRVYCRRIDTPRNPFPFEGGTYLMGRPPFSVGDEVALFQNLGVDWLVVKNSGGQASRSKLDAARLLGLKVAMIRRPDSPAGPRVCSVAAALAWVDGLA